MTYSNQYLNNNFILFAIYFDVCMYIFRLKINIQKQLKSVENMYHKLYYSTHTLNGHHFNELENVNFKTKNRERNGERNS